MTFEADELSQQDGAPVELYQFTRDLTDLTAPCAPSPASRLLYRYTSAESDIEFEPSGDSEDASSDSIWRSYPIERTAIEVSNEQIRNSLEITVPRTLAIAELFRVQPPTDVIGLTIFRYHRDSPSDSVVLWLGRVTNVDFRGAAAVLHCEPISLSLKRTGLRRLYQRQCPHLLYGPSCKADRESFSHETTVVSVSGNTVEVASAGSGSSDLSAPNYAGGFLEWQAETDGVPERRFITEWDAGSLTLVMSQPLDGITAGDSITLVAGCDHTMLTCSSVFDNLLNYGGFPFIPTKNPFDGRPIF